MTEVGCTSVFGVGERAFGAREGCREWEVMGEEGKGLGECGIWVMGCWVQLSRELSDAGPALPAAYRGEHWHLCSCCNNPGKCVRAKLQPVMSVPIDGRFSTPLLK